MHLQRVIIMNELARRLITALLFCTVLFGTLFFMPPYVFSFLLTLFCALCAVELYALFPFKRIYYWLLLPLYPCLSFSLLIALNYTHRYVLFLLITMVFAFDTGAYIIGSLVGRHKIWPAISPGKSWEGFIGGLICTVCYSHLIFFINGKTSIPMSVYPLILLLGALATIGDFFESSIKRAAGVKDSGNFLPGHGGFLDRFAAIIMVTPFFFFWSSYLNNLV